MIRERGEEDKEKQEQEAREGMIMSATVQQAPKTRIQEMMEEGRRRFDENLKGDIQLQRTVTAFRGGSDDEDTKLANLRLTNLLFPNRTGSLYPLMRHRPQEGRDLKGTYTTPVVCIKCTNMQFCPALDDYQIQEIYLPKDLEAHGTCTVLDQLGETVYNEVFGYGRTFRDDPECKQIVMQYLCLFWGSNNDQYTNFCVFQEDVTDANPQNHKVAPRPPCRSFCTQIATICAYDPLFINQCKSIMCPPTEDACTPDPELHGEVFAANLGCALPLYDNPYVLKKEIPNSAQRLSVANISMLPLLCLLVLTLMFWVKH